MAPMMVSYDLEAGATYLTLRDGVNVARTVSVSDLVMVDLDEHGEPVGVDFAVAPGQITDAMFDRLADRYPAQFKQLGHDRAWLFTHA